MKLRPDIRKFSEEEDRIGYCRRCGFKLILLPDDKRESFCFDCLDLLELSS
ncbi:MAG: hypothetical protein LN412_03880 [Candidatus Thermoplasmatota archaeon]|nr:hypothetical protein [Candidatus Thermoplasmatota archaeon]